MCACVHACVYVCVYTRPGGRFLELSCGCRKGIGRRVARASGGAAGVAHRQHHGAAHHLVWAGAALLGGAGEAAAAAAGRSAAVWRAAGWGRGACTITPQGSAAKFENNGRGTHSSAISNVNSSTSSPSSARCSPHFASKSTPHTLRTPHDSLERAIRNMNSSSSPSSARPPPRFANKSTPHTLRAPRDSLERHLEHELLLLLLGAHHRVDPAVDGLQLVELLLADEVLLLCFPGCACLCL